MASNEDIVARKHHASQRPPLTHFLCLPLLTPASTAELKASIAHLRSVVETTATAAAAVPEASGRQPVARPPSRIPPAAFRPLGTLHLTLGVMSLKEPERLQGAVEVLEKLDLEGMLRGVSEAKLGRGRTSEMVSEQRSGSGSGLGAASTTIAVRVEEQSMRGKRKPATSVGGEEGKGNKQALPPLERPTISSGSGQTPPPPPHLTPPPSPQEIRKVEDIQGQVPSPVSSPSPPPPPPPPLQISLRGLHPFPATDPTKATVLHTQPHDPTSRLYPFCLSVLSVFQRAGYLVRDRELRLHATVLNTVYAKGGRSRWRRGEKKKKNDKEKMNGKEKEKGKERLTLDATDVLRLFNQPDGRSFPRTSTTTTTTTTSSSSSSIATAITTTPGMMNNDVYDDDGDGDDDAATGFTFASHITLDRLQICEMGAKKLNPTTDDPGGVLGERYLVVAEKMILPPH